MYPFANVFFFQVSNVKTLAIWATFGMVQPKTNLRNISTWVGGAFFLTEICFGWNLFQTLAASHFNADVAFFGRSKLSAKPFHLTECLKFSVCTLSTQSICRSSKYWELRDESWNQGNQLTESEQSRQKIDDNLRSNISHLNRASLAVSPKMEATQMEIFNFLWLTWDH